MTKTYFVKGNAEEIAYTRVVRQSEQLVESCKHCGRRAYVLSYPGQKPGYCSEECRKEHERERQREKSKTRRAAKKKAG